MSSVAYIKITRLCLDYILNEDFNKILIEKYNQTATDLLLNLLNHSSYEVRYSVLKYFRKFLQNQKNIEKLIKYFILFAKIKINIF